MQKAIFYKKENEKLQCDLCGHFCVIEQNHVGKCGTRLNKDNKLYTLNYGFPSTQGCEPIEKNPLFHFLPGSLTYMVGTLGCNLECDSCQNWGISQVDEILKKTESMDYVDPVRVVENAIGDSCDSISFAGNEPTVFTEYALDIMKIAQQNELKNIWLTNGYMSPKTLELICPYLDAVRVDLKSYEKGFYKNNCNSDLQLILENLIKIKQEQIHLEITTSIIPFLSNDAAMINELVDFIVRELDSDTPWHVMKFNPKSSWKLQDTPATGEDMIYEAYEIGKNAGLKYVYVGNIPGDQKENTYCPKCGELAIRRLGEHIERLDTGGRCSFCDKNLDIVE